MVMNRECTHRFTSGSHEIGPLLNIAQGFVRQGLQSAPEGGYFGIMQMLFSATRFEAVSAIAQFPLVVPSWSETRCLAHNRLHQDQTNYH